MRLEAHLYVTTHGCTDLNAARALVHATAPSLDALYERSAIEGYQLFVLNSPDDYAEYDLDPEMIERETQGVFPAVYLNVTVRLDPSPPDVGAIAALVEASGFRHLLTDSEEP